MNHSIGKLSKSIGHGGHFQTTGKIKNLSMMSTTNLKNNMLYDGNNNMYGNRPLKGLDIHDLIVNSTPEIPLKVPLEKSS